MFAPRVCFVDVETTGSSPARERVTEIGVVTVDVDDDQWRVSEWSSLVNPGVPIPSEIQWLTGITNDMVRDAPAFSELAEPLFGRLQDAVFVAHNARFDYGFLKAEFARAGIAWRAATLCTVRLSRLLYPDRGPHNLDALVARFGLEGEQRHRALGDARVLWRWLRLLYDRHPRGDLDAAIERVLARPSTPPALPPHALDEVPHAPGVYLFFGAHAHPIYIGKSVDLRARIAGHFANDHASGADLRLSQEVQRVEWEETAGEIGALLREAELVKSRLPAYNIALRRKLSQVFFTLDEAGRPRFIDAADAVLDDLHRHHGPFGSRASARRLLVELAREHGLCLKAMGLERSPRLQSHRPPRGEGAHDARGRGPSTLPAEGLAGREAPRPCFNYQLKRCHGACVGVESAAAHAARVAGLLAPRRIAPWPHTGAIAIVEANADRFREDIHVFDRWCWLGSVRSLDAAQALARTAARAFEADCYRIARDALARAAAGRLQLVPLG